MKRPSVLFGVKPFREMFGFGWKGVNPRTVAELHNCRSRRRGTKVFGYVAEVRSAGSVSVAPAVSA